MKHYEAPWGRLLIVTSVLTTALCLGISGFVIWLAVAKHEPATLRWVALLPTVILLATVPFTIRGYAISSDEILVHRLLWSSSLPRAGLESAAVEPNAMRGSLRTFGNGGAFSFSGLYYNRRLGSYRAFVTDLHRTVVLRYANRRVVVSPATPQDFVDCLGIAKGA
jgi:hypothetical protein